MERAARQSELTWNRIYASRVSTASADLTTRLLETYRAPGGYYDPSRWWLDASLMADTVAGLADLHREGHPTAVAGVESRGQMLGALVARHLGIAFVEIRKNKHPLGVGEQLLRQTTPPDYKERGLVLAMRRGLLGARDRVLLVDDWIATGAQATAARALVDDAGATWVGVSVIVDGAPAAYRQALGVRSLVRAGQLPDG
ncbi:MAG: adenine phosphoribosyltransferase [Solirubrobacteraceae bacterium]|nr:adenine phosphoribosyltransferase [Solirubrobacteraceae bacterium]